MAKSLIFFEFFAGGGMARIGLGAGWRCLFANDFDDAKRAAYGANFSLGHHQGGDINTVTVDDLPRQTADLAWASSPCQDLSLAGARGGLQAARSGAVFGFWRLMEALHEAQRGPRTIVIENVVGLLTSRNGADFAAIVERLASRGYAVTALVLNAADFAPQSRPRLFIVGMPANACGEVSTPAIDAAAPTALHRAVALLSPAAQRQWRWMRARPRCARTRTLADILDWDAPYDTADKTRARLSAMSAHQRATLGALVGAGGRHVGAAYRRVRIENGEKKVRLEARFDGLSGCIRTPAGGSSRQVIIEIDKGCVRSRLMTPREAARAMGLSDDYVLPAGATAALKLIGDGVSPPVVRWLAENVIEPALARAAGRCLKRAAA